MFAVSDQIGEKPSFLTSYYPRMSYWHSPVHTHTRPGNGTRLAPLHVCISSGTGFVSMFLLVAIRPYRLETEKLYRIAAMLNVILSGGRSGVGLSTTRRQMSGLQCGK